MSKSNIAIKYRIYPTDEQKVLFAKTFGCCRKVWNLMLADKIESYKKTKSFGKQTPAMYKEEYPYLKEVDSLALANVQLALQKSLSMSMKNKQFGFPVFKSKHRNKASYTTNNQNGTVTISDKYIKLPKVGKVKAEIHRTIKDAVIKSATVSQDTDNKYYVSVLFEYDLKIIPKTVKSVNDAIGLDMNDKTLYVDSNGNTPDKLKAKDTSKSLKREQRKLSHMIESHITGYKNIKGNRVPVFDNKLSECKNIQKQRKKIAKIHKKQANQRMDFLHKTSNQITNDFSLICIEDLSVKKMMLTKDTEESAVKRHNINRKTLSNGWYNFTEMLIYKAQRKGGTVIKVPKDFPSSQMCSICGNVNQEITDLHIRKWICPVCNETHNRDINAAINIRNKGFQMYSEI